MKFLVNKNVEDLVDVENDECEKSWINDSKSGINNSVLLDNYEYEKLRLMI
ncbi:3525_t:CDS:2 [Funneliformis mosseae]|uniref:3525_t:CDS:1 n=1 Tax=Funneliformis mosseae TaxID=27381 RepID=A0A9N9C0W2_FUNMO|nr:3525_t:CDS:2 [Funneliformis mosseae]